MDLYFCRLRIKFDFSGKGLYMSKKKVVVSLGHKALGYTISEQCDAVKDTAKALADLVEADCQLTITHSNGPQVSMIHKAMTELRRIYIDSVKANLTGQLDSTYLVRPDGSKTKLGKKQ